MKAESLDVTKVDFKLPPVPHLSSSGLTNKGCFGDLVTVPYAFLAVLLLVLKPLSSDELGDNPPTDPPDPDPVEEGVAVCKNSLLLFPVIRKKYLKKKW